MGIVNLTRAVLPNIAKCSAENIQNIANMPETILRTLITKGEKGIINVDMNHCAAAVIKKDGIHTVFTDSLAGCNSVGIVATLVTKEPLCILSHYVPTNVEGQVNALKNQLKTYEPWIDKDNVVKLFFNLREDSANADINPIINRIISITKNFTAHEPTVSVTPYQNSNRAPFFSTANIFQFDTKQKLLKITNVGEKEQFIRLA